MLMTFLSKKENKKKTTKKTTNKNRQYLIKNTFVSGSTFMNSNDIGTQKMSCLPASNITRTWWSIQAEEQKQKRMNWCLQRNISSNNFPYNEAFCFHFQKFIANIYSAKYT